MSGGPGTHGPSGHSARAGGPPATLHALMAQLVDYAGLFPPAGLPLAAAARSYATYRKGRHAWMLGRFVVPASRLAEVSELGAEVLPVGDHAIPWRISALVGPDVDRDFGEIRAFNERHAAGASGGRAVVDSLETRVSTPADVARVASGSPRHARVAYEIAIDREVEPFLLAVREARGVVKARLGGVVPSAIPAMPLVASWLARAAAHDVAIKATAGLHHALRAERPLTYDEASPRGVMHGFLNVFVAACLAHAGRHGLDRAGVKDLASVLEGVLGETDPGAFAHDDEVVRWRGRSLTLAQVSDARREFALAFGSCSFEEPVGDLEAMGMFSRSA